MEGHNRIGNQGQAGFEILTLAVTSRIPDTILCTNSALNRRESVESAEISSQKGEFLFFKSQQSIRIFS